MHAIAAEVTATYNGDLVIPLPEMDRNEKRAVPNLLSIGLDQTAMRINSVLPDVFCPPQRPGFLNSEANSRIRRQAHLSWWQESNFKTMMGRRARHLLGYTYSPVLIEPDFIRGIPAWRILHPLSTYPSPKTNPDDVISDDCIYSFTRTLGWLKRQYPEHYAVLAKGPKPSMDQKVTLLNYIDDVEKVMIVLGEKPEPYSATNGLKPHVELERIENRAGVCTVISPGNITLDRPKGKFDGMVGLYQRQARMMALDAIAVEQDIFPDEWMIARQNENPVVVQWADGRAGVTGIARGIEKIEVIQKQPGYKTDTTISYLDQAQHIEGGIPMEFGGQSGTNIRTGKRGDSILSAVVDFPIMEAHNLFSTSCEWENRAAVATAKGYFGNEPKSFYVNWKGAKGNVDYTPNKDFPTDANIVTYAHPGADVNNLIIGIGQMIGVGLISTELGREMNPMIDDPEREHDRVTAEALEKATLGSVTQGALTGQIAPADMARIHEMVVTNKVELFAAIQIVQREVQERQASEGPPGTPTGPVAPGAPEAQPGLGAEGSSAGAGTIGPTENESGLAALMAALQGGAKGAA